MGFCVYPGMEVEMEREIEIGSGTGSRDGDGDGRHCIEALDPFCLNYRCRDTYQRFTSLGRRYTKRPDRTFNYF